MKIVFFQTSGFFVRMSSSLGDVPRAVPGGAGMIGEPFRRDDPGDGRQLCCRSTSWRNW